MKNKIIILLLSLFFIFSVIQIPIASAYASQDIDPESFSPGDNNGFNDSVTITVTDTPSQTLYVNIQNTSSTVYEAEDRSMTESPSGTYVYTWDGKNESYSYVPDGLYTVKVSTNPSSMGDTIGTLTVNTTTPGSPSVTVDGGATYATSVNVNLTISATGVEKMRVSNYANFTSATWETYSTLKEWTLLSGDGAKTVYVDFKSVSGANVSAFDDITLDTTLADPALSINSGASSTNDRNVTLTITANGASQMKIDNDTDFSNMSSWITAASTYNFTLPTGLSSPSVHLRVKDEANNQKTTSDSIDVDSTAPTNLSITIDDGATYANTTTVNLSLSANGGPTTMYISNNGSIWQEYDYDTTKSWTLDDSTGDGIKTVYFKAKDGAGNNATAVTSSITLDTTNPSQATLSSPASGATVTTQTPTFTFTNPNNVSTTRAFYIEILSGGSVTQFSDLNSTTTTYEATTLAAGVYTWRVTVYDLANNSAITSQRSFTISITGLSIPSQTYPEDGADVNSTSYTDSEILMQCGTVTSGDGTTVYYDFRWGASAEDQSNTSGTTNTNPYFAISTSLSHDDTIYWSVRGRNGSGSTSYSSNRSFTVDIQEPTLNSISINSAAAYINTTSSTLTLSATGATWMDLSESATLNGETQQAYSSSKAFTISSTDGTKTVYFIANDSAVGEDGLPQQNSETSAISDTIILDTTGPVFANNTPAATATSTTPTISSSFNDTHIGQDNSTLIVTVDDVNQTSNCTIFADSYEYTPSALTDGQTYWVNASINDALGNAGNTSWSFTVSTGGDGDGDSDGDGDGGGGGLPPPAAGVTITNPASGTSYTSTDIITVTATETITSTISQVKLKYTIDGGDEQSINMESTSTSTYSVSIGPFEQGSITFYVYILDDTGTSYESASRTVTIADTRSPQITIVSPTSGSSITDLKPMIKASYSDNGGIDTDTVTITLNGEDITASSTITDSYVAYTPTEDLAYGTYTITVSVVDTSDNSESIAWNFTVVAETIEIVEIIQNLEEGKTTTWESTEEGSRIKTIEITPSKDIAQITMIVNSYDESLYYELTEEVPTPTEKVYLYLEIETDATDDITEAKLKFELPKSWLELHKIDLASITLLRYTENNWEKLPTIKVDEDTNNYYFEATTAGFSTFAIVGTAKVEPPDEFPWILVFIVIIGVILVIILLFKSGFLFFERVPADKYKKKPPKKK